MVTIQEAQQSTVQARSDIAEQRSNISERESDVEKAREQLLKQQRSLPNVTSQKYLRGQSGSGGLAGREQRKQVQNISQEIESKISAVAVYEKGLKDYREQVLKPYESQISGVEQQISAENTKQSQYEVGYKLGVKGDKISRHETAWAKKGYEAGKSTLAAGTQAKDIRDITGLSIPEYKELDLNKLSQTQLKSLEGKGYVTTTVSEIDTSRLNRKDKLDIEKYNVIIPETDKATNKLFEVKDVKTYGPIQQKSITKASRVSALTGVVKPLDYKQEKTTFQKVRDFTFGIGDDLRDVSKTQASLVSAEKILGLGNVGSVGGEKISRITDIKKIPETIITYAPTKVTAMDLKTVDYSKQVPSSIGNDILGIVERGGEELRKSGRWLDETGKIGAQAIGGFAETGLNKIRATSIPNIRPVGKRIGDRINNPSKYKDNSLFGKSDAVYDTETKVVRLPTDKEKLGVARLSKKEKEEYNPESVITSKQIGSGITFAGEATVGLGKYLVPVYGTSLAISQAQGELKEYDYNAVALAKEEPLKAALGVGIILGAAALKDYKYWKSPVEFSRGGKAIVSTKGAELFGKRIKVSGYKDGEGLFGRGIKVETKQSESYLSSTSREVLKKGEIDPKSTLFSQKKITDEGEKTVTTFVIRKEGDIVRDTTRYSKDGSKLFDNGGAREATRTYPLPDKFIRPKDGMWINNDAPFIIETRKLSTSTGKLGKAKYEIIGGTKLPMEITKEQIKDLRPVERYLGEKTISKTKGVPRNNIDKFVGEGDKLFINDIRIRDTTKPTGKQTRTYEQFAILGEGKQVGKGNIYDLAIGNKDITNPMARASGKIPTAKIKVIELPVADMTTLEKNIITSSGTVTKTPFSTTFPKQVVETQQKMVLESIPIIKAPPKVSAPRPVMPTAKQTESFTSPIAIPKAKSAFYGKGQYERTEEFASPVSISKGKITSGNDISFKTNLAIISNVKQNVKQDTFQKSYSKSLNILKSDLRLKQESITKLGEKALESERFGQKYEVSLKDMTKSILKSKQIERIAQDTKTVQFVKVIPDNVPLIKSPENIILLAKKIKQKQKLNAIASEDSALGTFKVFVKKFGKDVEVGSAGTKQEAFGLLGSELKETLRASGFVKKGGKKIKPTSFGAEFRPGKSDSFTVVQKKTKRFGSGSETKEAQLFRKSTKKTKKKKNRFL